VIHSGTCIVGARGPSRGMTVPMPRCQGAPVRARRSCWPHTGLSSSPSANPHGDRCPTQRATVSQVGADKYDQLRKRSLCLGKNERVVRRSFGDDSVPKHAHPGLAKPREVCLSISVVPEHRGAHVFLYTCPTLVSNDRKQVASRTEPSGHS
jgi:hypothetical protein